jgi:hypothetical protein
MMLRQDIHRFWNMSPLPGQGIKGKAEIPTYLWLRMAPTALLQPHSPPQRIHCRAVTTGRYPDLNILEEISLGKQCSGTGLKRSCCPWTGLCQPLVNPAGNARQPCPPSYLLPAVTGDCMFSTYTGLGFWHSSCSAEILVLKLLCCSQCGICTGSSRYVRLDFPLTPMSSSILWNQPNSWPFGRREQ